MTLECTKRTASMKHKGLGHCLCSLSLGIACDYFLPATGSENNKRAMTNLMSPPLITVILCSCVLSGLVSKIFSVSRFGFPWQPRRGDVSHKRSRDGTKHYNCPLQVWLLWLLRSNFLFNTVYFQ